MNNAVFGKNYGECELTYRYQACNKRIKKELFGFRTKPFFSQKFVNHRNEKKQIFMNNQVYLGLWILEISKIEMYEFWLSKPKYGVKAKLCYLNTIALYST